MDGLRIVAEQNQAIHAPGAGRTFAALPSARDRRDGDRLGSQPTNGTPSDLSFQWCFDVT